MEQSTSLSLVELLKIANEAYEDGYLSQYFDPDTGAARSGSGDTLAEFIVREIRDTFDSNALVGNNSRKHNAFSKTPSMTSNRD